MSVHVWAVMSKGMIIYKKIGVRLSSLFCWWPHRCGQRECIHTYVHALLWPYNTHTFLILFLDFISSLNQLIFRLLGICVAHFRIITLDLLNHSFLGYLIMMQRSEQKSEKGGEKKTSELRAKRIRRHTPSLHWLCIFQHFHSPAQHFAACRQVCVSLVCLW